MRTVLLAGALSTFAGSLCWVACGTTLQQLSLDEMIQKSTEIVRGKVQCTGAALRGSTLYTNYRLQVSETWKGFPGSQLDFAVPGGFSNGVRQTYSGAPSPADGQEFVLFLWTSKTGLRQVIGLSQGLFTLTSSNGQLFATRGATNERIVDASGQLIQDSNFTMALNDLRSRVADVLSGRSR